MSDLDKLIAAVERGDVDAVGRLSCACFHDSGLCVEVFNAFCGSLDAAKALHEALLPGVRYLVGGDKYDWPENTGAIVFSNPKQVAIVSGNNPARSWLLAILKAYRSMM